MKKLVLTLVVAAVASGAVASAAVADGQALARNDHGCVSTNGDSGRFDVVDTLWPC